jgi:hypothetical protein
VTSESEFGGSQTISSERGYYRIVIKTAAPDTLRPQLVQALSTVDARDAGDNAATGVELPGGIMFDVFVPIKQYKEAQKLLVHLGASQIVISHARQRGRAGKARVKIWVKKI